MQLTFTAETAREYTDAIKRDGMNVAERLKIAHDTKLWKLLNYDTWKGYCEEEFGYSKNYSNRLIQFAVIAENLAVPIGTTSESQVRPLAHLPPEQQKEVWQKALEIGGSKPTARDVKRAVEESKPQEARSEFLNKLGVTSAEPIADTDPDDDDPKGLWALKFAWKKAKKSEKSAFLKWVSGRGEAQ